MLINTQAFCSPKRGNALSECEDACFPDRVSRRNVSEFHCAVADGASESAFSGEWARLLVRGFSRRRLRLRRLQRSWLRIVSRRPMPWYLEAKIRRGAHAALVGLSIRDGSPLESVGGPWMVAAVGDSCLFHVRDDRLQTAVPVHRSTDFDNTPRLISTDASTSFGVDESCLKVVAGAWRPRDVFYLATDALAEWALAEEEAGRPPWSVFRELGTDQAAGGDGGRSFESIVADLREEGSLRNDDTTLLRVEVTT